MNRLRRMYRQEDGFGLIEQIMAATLMIVIMSASLFTFNQFERNSNINQAQNDSQDRVRMVMDQQARELRNLASPTPEQPLAVDKATGYDIVFQTVDPAGPNTGLNASNVRRVRYCLNTTSPNNELIYTQSQTWTSPAPPTVPSTASCPDSAWGNQKIVAQNVVNRVGGADRPVWSFNSTTLTAVDSIRTDLFVDINPGKAPRETDLRSGVFLRNQNQPPVSRFTQTVVGSGHVLLNGSSSEDPEADSLTYVWYDGSTKIGTGLTLDYTLPGGCHSITLKTYDPAGLEGVSDPQTSGC